MLTLRPYQKSIMDSIYESMKSGHRRPLVCAPCGSGKTVIFTDLAERTQAKGKTVAVLVHRRELMRQTKDTFHRSGVGRELVQIHMAQTFSRHLVEYERPDLIITDEAHFSAAPTWQRIFDHWPESYVVGFSATPARLDGKPLGAIYDDLILGPTTAELIRDGWLSDYRYFSVTVADIAKLKRRGVDYDMESAADLLGERAVYGDVIKTFRDKAADKRTVVYCTTVEHSMKTAAEFVRAGFVAEHIDGTTPPEKRDAIIKRFRKGKTQILTNCQIVDVGFDLPAIECCIMLRPTMSTAMFVQQSGRALRPLDGKTAIILDFVGNHIRHGLPDDDRAWNLNERLPVRENAAPDGSFLIRQCRDCFAVYPATEPACPECGAEYTATRAEIQQIQEARLTEIRRREAERIERWKGTRMGNIQTEADCNTYADLCLLAKKQGASNVRKWATAASYRLGIRRPWE